MFRLPSGLGSPRLFVPIWLSSLRVNKCLCICGRLLTGCTTSYRYRYRCCTAWSSVHVPQAMDSSSSSSNIVPHDACRESLRGGSPPS